MLQKYEAEVRNHIKIEQQLKLHIECIQDKLDDIEKNKEKTQNQKKKEDEESVKELAKLKELVISKDKEVESMRQELRKVKTSNDEFKSQIEILKRDLFTLREKSKSPVKTYSRA